MRCPKEAPDGRAWLDVPAAELPETGVSIGLAPEGAPESEVEFDTSVGSFPGRFETLVDDPGLPPGLARAWVRVCLGGDCRTASTPIEG